jgi:hypothetical protein
MARLGERPKILAEHHLTSTDEQQSAEPAVNTHIRDCEVQSQNVDKGFDRYIRHFKPHHDIRAAIRVEIMIISVDFLFVLLFQDFITICRRSSTDNLVILSTQKV